MQEKLIIITSYSEERSIKEKILELIEDMMSHNISKHDLADRIYDMSYTTDSYHWKD